MVIYIFKQQNGAFLINELKLALFINLVRILTVIIKEVIIKLTFWQKMHFHQVEIEGYISYFVINR